MSDRQEVVRDWASQGGFLLITHHASLITPSPFGHAFVAGQIAV
jgi:hypothetical protein